MKEIKTMKKVEGEATDKKVDKLLEIIAETITGAEAKGEIQTDTLWPLYTPYGLLFWGKEWAGKLHLLITKFDQLKVSDKEVAPLFMASSRIGQSLWRLDALKQSDLEIPERLHVIEKLLDWLGIYRGSNIFCEDGKNIIWDTQKLQEETAGLRFTQLRKDKEAKSLVCSLGSTLWLYCELLYWTNHPFGHSFHGPYKTPEGDLIVRNYFDLKPEIWPFTKELNFSQLELFEVYRNADLKFDFFERGIRTQKPYRERLVDAAAKINGKVIGVEELQSAYESVKQTMAIGTAAFQALNQQGIIAKHAEMWFYILKPLAGFVGENWQLTSEVHSNIWDQDRFKRLNRVWKEMQKGYRESASVPLELEKQNIKRNFDPRAK